MASCRSAVLLLLCMLCCHVLTSAHRDCFTRTANSDDVDRAIMAEKATYGVIAQRAGAITAQSTAFSLPNIPVHFHVMTNTVVNTRRVNVPMLKHMVECMNADFDGFMTFVYTGFNTTVQPRARTCDTLILADYKAFVTKIPNWKVKFHIVICEMESYSGYASFPFDFQETDPRHNLIHIDYRAVACKRRDTAAALNTCDPKWWRTRNVVAAHEFGHILGLYHTFQGGCTDPSNDGVDDTPAEDPLPDAMVKECPGISRLTNTCCSGPTKNPIIKKCKSPPGCNSCNLMDPKNITFLTASKCPPVCCLRKTANGTTAVGVKPLDSCPKLPGVDPVVNFMSYSPDYCLLKGGKLGTNNAGFTPGQVARMQAMVTTYKTLIYRKYCRCAGGKLCNFNAAAPCGLALG